MARLLLATALALGFTLAFGMPATANAQVPETCPEDDRGVPRIADCGVQLAPGVTSVTWDLPSMPVALAFEPSRFTPAAEGADAPPLLEVWTREPGSRWWWGWSRVFPSAASAGEVALEEGRQYWFLTPHQLVWSPVQEVQSSVQQVGQSIFETSQIVSLYGYPGIDVMGALGKYSPEDAADEALRLAAEFDALNEGTQTLAALHLIVSVAQPYPGDTGKYLYYIPDELLDEYIRVTAERDMLLFLDVQIGWSDPLVETRVFEDALRNPHVHYAVDPEFATERKDLPPGRAIGTVTADEINQIQQYLAELAAEHGLPPKVFVVHQFRGDMITDPADIAEVDGVDLVIDMDGWGPPGSKLSGYDTYALADYAEYPGFKLFYQWDKPMLTIEELQALETPPVYVIYQ